MSEFPEQLISIKGVDRATPAAEAPDGSCLAIENLVPVGPPENPYWSVATAPTQLGSVNDILSLGRQTRDRKGPFTKEDEYPGIQASLDRLVALKQNGIYIIDPGNSYAEAKVYEFGTPDSTRRATFTSVADTVYISITLGNPRRPGRFLALRDDTVEVVRWAPLPFASVSWTGKSSSKFLPEGKYAFRLAWRLDDGTIGPAGEPIISETPGGSSSYIPKIEIGRTPAGRPPSWDQRASEINLILHVPTTDSNGNVTSAALQNPGYIVGSLQSKEGSTLSYSGTKEEAISSTPYPVGNLGQHRTQPGCLFSYNKRLVLGDIRTDFYKPNIRRILSWEDGVSNDGTDLHWVLFEVQIRTSIGVVRRYSQPVPYENSTSAPTAADEVSTRNGVVYYRDDRAFRWRLLVSTDYTEGDPLKSATWKRLKTGGVAETFRDSGGANFAYRDVSSQEPFDLASTTSTQTEAAAISDVDADGDGSNEWVEVSSSDYDGNTLSPFQNEIHGVAEKTQFDDFQRVFRFDKRRENTLDLSTVLSGDLDKLDFVYSISENFQAEGDATVEISETLFQLNLEDANDNILAQESRSLPSFLGGITLGGYFSDADGDFTAGDEDHLRLILEVRARVDGGDPYTYELDITINQILASVTTDTVTSGDLAAPVDITPQSDNAETVRSPNKIVWSEPFQPLNRPAENLVYAGDEDSDPVLGVTSVGKPVSEGQFGEYPLIVFSEQSVRLLSVGSSDTFITGVAPLTSEMGIVGRRAYSNTDGVVTAAMDRGVYQFTPNLQQPALSEPLHDVRDEFLNDLGADTAVGFYAERDRGRRELWVAGNNQTWCYSLKHGAWTQLSRQRVDFVRLDNRLRGVNPQGNIQSEFGSTSEQVDYTVVTSLEHFGEVGKMERLKTLLIQQRFMMEELRWKLCTKDPNASQALKAAPLNRATLPDGLTARDLLPNVLVESGTDQYDRGPLARGDIGTIPLASGLGYSWFLRMEGTGEPDQGIEGFGAEFQPRRRVRPSTFFPDQPETAVLNLDADVNNDGKVAVRVLDTQNGSGFSNLAAILWGDGTSDASATASHQYDTSGVYTNQLVAQPDFQGAGHVQFIGAYDLSTLSLQNAPDVVVLELSTNSDDANVGLPFGSLATDIFVNSLTKLLANDIPNISYDLTDVHDQQTVLNSRKNDLTGTWPDVPDQIETLNFKSTSVQGKETNDNSIGDGTPFNGNVIPPNLRVMAGLTTDIEVKGTNGQDGSADLRDHGKLERVNWQGQQVQYDLIMQGNANLIVMRGFNGAEAYGDLSGSDANGNPYIKSEIRRFSHDINKMSGAPSDWSQSDSVARFDMSKGFGPGGSAAKYGAGKGLYNAVTATDGLYVNRGVSANPNLIRFFDYIVDDWNSNSVGNERVIGQSVDQANQEGMIWRLLGMDQYHPNGVIDAGWRVLDDVLYQFSITSREGNQTFRCKAPDEDYGTNNTKRFGSSNTYYQKVAYDNDSDGSDELVDEPVFQVGNQIRIEGGSGSDRIHKIASSTYDPDNDGSKIAEITIESNVSSPLSGTLANDVGNGAVRGYLTFPRSEATK